MVTERLILVSSKLIVKLMLLSDHQGHRRRQPCRDCCLAGYQAATVAAACLTNSSLLHPVRLLVPCHFLGLTSGRIDRSLSDSIAKFCPYLCLSFPFFEIGQAVEHKKLS